MFGYLLIYVYIFLGHVEFTQVIFYRVCDVIPSKIKAK